MTAQVNIINDIGSLTKIPIKILNEIINKECLCIGSAIHDAKLGGNDVAILNIGLGTLSVNLQDMQCKFVPGKELKSMIKRSLSGKIDPLEAEMKQELIDKLLAICEEVL